MEPTRQFKLTIEEHPATREVVLRMDFHNECSESLRAPFSNQTRRLERVDLRIASKDGAAVKPSTVVVVRPRQASSAIEIPAGGTWTYELKAKLLNGNLEFPGATYLLEAGENYELSMACKGWISNCVMWKVPPWKGS
jgi:hypothetical protein